MLYVINFYGYFQIKQLNYFKELDKFNQIIPISTYPCLKLLEFSFPFKISRCKICFVPTRHLINKG